MGRPENKYESSIVQAPSHSVAAKLLEFGRTVVLRHTGVGIALPLVRVARMSVIGTRDAGKVSTGLLCLRRSCLNHSGSGLNNRGSRASKRDGITGRHRKRWSG